MKRDIKGLLAFSSDIDMQAIVKSFEREGYSITLTFLDVREILNSVVRTDAYDLIILDITGLGQNPDEVDVMLDQLGLEIPIIMLVNRKEDQEGIRNFNYFRADCMLRDDLGCMGMMARHLLRETYLYNQLQSVETVYNKKIEHLTTTLASIGDGVITADLYGYVTFMNQPAMTLTGWSQQEARQKQLDTIFKLVDKKTNTPMEGIFARAIRRGRKGGLRKSTVLVAKDGSEHYISASSSPIRDNRGKIIGVITVFRDITKIKGSERELEVAKEAAEAANLAKSEFLANMSHEIRTPLNGMVGMIDLTLLTDLSEEQKDNLLTAKECATTLLNLINDILDFSKIEAGKLNIEDIDFDFRKLINQSVKLHRVSAGGKGLEFRLFVADEIPRVVNGDPHRLKQVINNLLVNAVKFTSAGEVALSVDLVSQTDEGLVFKFAVTDTGIGIDGENIGRLFETFSQVDGSHTRKYGGTGLGLPIARQLVEKMGGSIGVESVLGKGSTFFFTIKFGLGGELEGQAAKVPVIKRTSHPQRVLLVEDDLVNQAVMARMIVETGHRVLTANNGEEALELLRHESVDLIFMDIQMPVLDGVETTARIRAREKSSGRHVPIIAITAYALQGDKEKFLAAGMDDYMAKPVSMEDLLSVMERAAKGLVKGRWKAADLRDNVSLDLSRQAESVLDKIADTVNRLNYSFVHNDVVTVEEYAHQIKKLAARISAIGVRSVAFKIELAARRNNLAQAAEHFAGLAEELARFKQKMGGQREYEDSNSGRRHGQQKGDL